MDAKGTAQNKLGSMEKELQGIKILSASCLFPTYIDDETGSWGLSSCESRTLPGRNRVFKVYLFDRIN